MFRIVRLLHQATSHALCWLVIFGDGLPWIEFGHFVWFSYSWSSHRWYLVAIIYAFIIFYIDYIDNVGKIISKLSNYQVLGWFQVLFFHYGILWGGTILTLPIGVRSVSFFRWHCPYPSLSRYDMATYTRFNSMVTWRIRYALVNACYRLSAWVGMFGVLETSKTCWGCIHEIKCSLNRLQHMWCLTRLLWLDAELHCWRFHNTPGRNLYKVDLDLSTGHVWNRPLKHHVCI